MNSHRIKSKLGSVDSPGDLDLNPLTKQIYTFAMLVRKFLIMAFCFAFYEQSNANLSSIFDSFVNTNGQKLSDADANAFIKNINRSLPKVVDRNTVLTKISLSSAGDFFVYEYEINERKDRLSASIISNFNHNAAKNSCSNVDVIKMASLRSGVIHQYRDKLGDYITSFKITLDLCAKLNSPNYLDYVGEAGGTKVYVYKRGRARVGDLITGSSLHEGKPYSYRGFRITSLKFDLEFDCGKNLYKINNVSTYEKSFGIDLLYSEDKSDGWKVLGGNANLIKMTRDFLCQQEY